MREFKLVNANGLEWDLMRKDAFFHAPDGLGFGRTISAVQVGGSYIETGDSLDQKAPSGEMVFLGYEEYSDFISFIAKTPLVLMYKPLQKWFRLKCKISSLGKTEIIGGRLICPISFTALSTWYELLNVRQNIPQEGTGKIYPYTYPYVYSDTTVATAEIENGDRTSPTIIQIFGPVKNPSWILNHNGGQVASGYAEVTIPKGHKLVINSDPAEMEIAEYTVIDNAFVEDHYSKGDFSTERFIFVPPGKSRLSIFDETGGDIEAYVEVEKLADSV